jgi:hypothetical protein
MLHADWFSEFLIFNFNFIAIYSKNAKEDIPRSDTKAYKTNKKI